MTLNLVEISIVLVLLLVIVVQALERYFFAEQANNDRSKLIAALLSKNMNEYTSAIRIEKEEKAPDFQQVDEVELANASDEEFGKFIKEQTK